MAPSDGIAHLVEEGIIDAVHARLMSGKEATVYVVERRGIYMAAKVYRARNDRTFKKTESYTEGRNQTRNSRDRRAMGKRSSYGRELLEEGWQDMEYRALRAAFNAGVRVPEPFAVYENVLFMDLVLDDQGAPAPRLADLTYTAEQAAHVHWDVFMQVKRLLETGQIHGDLSAYNVLMSAHGPTIIDLPQVVDVVRNNNARDILRRDLRNVTEHLARYDARLLRFADCGQALYEHLQYGTLDMVTAPEEGAQRMRGGRRGRDAERGRAGRDKTARTEGPRVDAPPRRQAPARGVQIRAQPSTSRQRQDQGVPTGRAPRHRRGPG
ncbi:MAG: RIO1 family regulatory kinase/ATPase [Deltaproteobacteria bacterium]|nr:RIO1 family regulatory kinase/ATPase [Deltaproteobacteria bacterium]